MRINYKTITAPEKSCHEKKRLGPPKPRSVPIITGLHFCCDEMAVIFMQSRCSLDQEEDGRWTLWLNPGDVEADIFMRFCPFCGTCFRASKWPPSMEAGE